MDRIRVAACQVNTVVGDLSGNVARILAALGEAERGGADIAVFPELAVTGYPPEDLLGRPSFIVDNLAALEEVAASTRACTVVVGHVDRDAAGRLVNAAALCAGGRITGRYHKRILPNYGVFDEQRWFVPGREAPTAFVVAGVPVGLSVCEDMWFVNGPMRDEARAGARLLVNLNASPYSRGRREERLAVLAERVAETGCAIVYVNQVGGQDELVFDGASLVVGADGELLGSARQFEEEVLLVDVESPRAAPGRGRGDRGLLADEVSVSVVSRSEGWPPLVPSLAPVLGAEEEVYEALLLGTRDYVLKNGFSDAVIGLSGGIDSSLVATIAVDALGPAHVHGVTMPSRYSSGGSITDAVALGANLGIEVSKLPIEPVHRAFAETLALVLPTEPTGLTDENLQSRLRGVLLMALSNANGWIVLTTGNKSEMATGYSTLYGDSAGGFAVIKDVPKTLVYELCLHRNKTAGFDLVPEAVLTKAPSAELRPDQRDEESLPPYPVLDPVIAGYVEGDRSADDLIAEGYDPAVVARVVELVDRAEYKRRQMPPGVRISTKAFGRDRRMPITNHYRTGTRPPVGRQPGGESDGEAPAVV